MLPTVRVEVGLAAPWTSLAAANGSIVARCDRLRLPRRGIPPAAADGHDHLYGITHTRTVLLPGLNDLTAHVDFTAMADAPGDLQVCTTRRTSFCCGLVERWRTTPPGR
jgi:hypothetical protein